MSVPGGWVPPGSARPRMAIALLIAAAGCSRPGASREAPLPGEWLTFEGNWSATGDRQTLHLGPERSASIASLTGSLLLTGRRGLGVGFEARAIVFSDSATGGVGRCVWVDERGDQIFSDLTGGPVASGRHVTGTITGGTGRYTGLIGEYAFDWMYAIEAEDGRIQGRAVGLKGRARVGGEVPARPPPGGAPR
jgi:hypothetical protein